MECTFPTKKQASNRTITIVARVEIILWSTYTIQKKIGSILSLRLSISSLQQIPLEGRSCTIRFTMGKELKELQLCDQTTPKKRKMLF